LDSSDIEYKYRAYKQVLIDMEICKFASTRDYKGAFREILLGQKQQITIYLDKKEEEVWKTDPQRVAEIREEEEKAIQKIDNILTEIDKQA